MTDSAEPTVVRMRRPLMRLCARILPYRSYRTPLTWLTLPEGRTLLLFGLGVLWMAGFLVALATLASAGEWSLFLMALVIPGIPLLWVVLVALSGAFYTGGAGFPVLVVTDGVVRGQLRPVWADEEAEADPTREDWWDVRVPAAELAGVRVDRDGTGTPILILDLPEGHGEALATDPQLAEITEIYQRRYGSRAAWSLVLTQPRLLRAKVLRGVLDDLHRGGAPTPTDVPAR